MDSLKQAIEALSSFSKAQTVLAEAILKRNEIDAVDAESRLMDAESRLIMARATENNSEVNLNCSKSIINDKAIIERLLTIIESYKQ